MSAERHRIGFAAKVTTAVISFAVGLPLLYFLSAGPFIRIYYNKIPPVAVEHFYAPLQWVYNNTPPLRGVMDWYGKLWAPESKL